ncbi:MAG: polyhydroxyalkanoic acid system family protein [Sphingomicrobium sp.]
MQKPIQVDLPHKLGRDEARRRIANNIHQLKDHIPGGSAHVESNWIGDELNLTISALGQEVAARIGVQETKVHVEVMLPGMLAMFAGPIQAMLQKKGNILLEDKRD